MKENKHHPRCRWRRRKEARPSEILDAALSLFVERGYAATTLEQVARAAGISKGTLYLYYDNKEELFRSMVRELLVPHVEQFEKHAAEFRGSSAELLRGMAHNWWRAVGDSALAGMPKLMIAEAGNFPELAHFYVETVIVRGRKLVADILQRGIDRGEFRQIDTDLAARVMLYSLVFAAIWKNSLAIHDKSYSHENYIDLHVDMALNGLTK
jgi:AcrR family transcriptional regulator